MRLRREDYENIHQILAESTVRDDVKGEKTTKKKLHDRKIDAIREIMDYKYGKHCRKWCSEYKGDCKEWYNNRMEKCPVHKCKLELVSNLQFIQSFDEYKDGDQIVPASAYISPPKDYRYSPETIFDPEWRWLDIFQQFMILSAKIPNNAKDKYTITAAFAVLQDEDKVKQYLKDNGDKDSARSIRRWVEWMDKNLPEDFEKVHEHLRN